MWRVTGNRPPPVRFFALVAQLDRAPDFESVGSGFESPRGRQPVKAKKLSPETVGWCEDELSKFARWAAVNNLTAVPEIKADFAFVQVDSTIPADSDQSQTDEFNTALQPLVVDRPRSHSMILSLALESFDIPRTNRSVPDLRPVSLKGTAFGTFRFKIPLHL